ncbi:MAG: penicillin acylase family protein, partial [Rhodospirillaceae bacterium]
MRVETPDRLWAGGTFPGVPLLVLGHNGDIAWSLTTTHSDTADLVVERVTADGDYLTEDGPEAFIERQETIQVRFSEPETITVRASRAGPVLSDAAPRWIAPMVEVSRTSLGPPENADEETVLVLRAAALAGDDRTATAMFGINHARNWPDFVAALEDFHSPQQNFVYADRSGTIGLLNRGRLPNRIAVAEETDPIAQARLDGRLPRPGWTDQGKWQGWVAPAALPRVVNPPSGFLMNTNNKVSAPDDPLFLTHRWNGLWRAQRLERLLTHKDDHQLIDMGIYQLDSLSEAVAWMLPDLIRLAREAPQPHGEGFTKALGLLEEWTIAGDMNQNRVEPLLATSWMFLLS